MASSSNSGSSPLVVAIGLQLATADYRH